MNPFLREHAAPLVGSTLLHVLLAAAALVATWFAVTPKIVVPAVIEAYIAAAPAARPQPAPAAAPAPAPAPEPEPVKVVPDPAELQAQQEAARARDDAALAAKREEALRLEHDADVRAADSTRQKQRDADAHRHADAAAEARRRADATAEARRHVEAEAEAARRHQAEEAKRAADAAEKRRTDAEAKQRAARETDLAKELAAEEQRTGAVNAGLQARYAAEIRARVERAWNRPPTARPGLNCKVYVTQVPGGTVTDVKLGACNGDAAVQQSITLAVFRASPLPTPPDPSLFERHLQLEFAPND